MDTRAPTNFKEPRADLPSAVHILTTLQQSVELTRCAPCWSRVRVVGRSSPTTLKGLEDISMLKFWSVKRAIGTLVTTALMTGCGAAYEGRSRPRPRAKWKPEPELELGTVEQGLAMSMLGADVSSLQRTVDLGGSYYDAAGAKKDPLDILKSKGVNYARLRVWNNPASGYNNKAKVLAYAQDGQGQGPEAPRSTSTTRTPGPTRASSSSPAPGRATTSPAADRRLQLHARRLQQPEGAGHHAGQRADRQRDQRRHAVERRQGHQQRLHQPERCS